MSIEERELIRKARPFFNLVNSINRIYSYGNENDDYIRDLDLNEEGLTFIFISLNDLRFKEPTKIHIPIDEISCMIKNLELNPEQKPLYELSVENPKEFIEKFAKLNPQKRKN